MAKIKFVRSSGGLGRRKPGGDHISGLVVYGQLNVGKVLLLDVEQLESMGVSTTTHPVLHYHVSEYFRVSPGSQLYIVSRPLNEAQYGELKQLQQFAEGNIKQIGIVDLLANFEDLTACAVTISARLSELSNENMPLIGVLSIHNITSANLLSLPNLHNLNCERLSVCIGQDTAGRGNFVSRQLLKKVGIVGACLGAISRAKVHESIGWIEKQNLVDLVYPKVQTGNLIVSRELDQTGFIDGSLLSSFSAGQLQSIDDKGYLFLIKHIGISGSYFNDSFSAVSLESDFCMIENNRCVDKAQRLVYAQLLPKILGPIYIDPNTGLISQDSIASLEALGAMPLEQMERDGELSGFKVIINPSQDVLANSQIEVTLAIVPVGVLREIVVNIGFAKKV